MIEQPSDRSRSGRPRRWMMAIAVLATLAALVLAGLLVTIAQRKGEARSGAAARPGLASGAALGRRAAAVGSGGGLGPEAFAQAFPFHYDDYRKTSVMQPTVYGGSEAVPRVPTSEDPRDVVSKSKLDTVPQLRRMWAGYAFARDFREDRGHAYMLDDQVYTERQKVGQPGTCIHCHASTFEAMQKLGDGDLTAGFHALNGMPYSEAKSHVAGPVGCIDCHDAQTMALRVTRPAFVAGIAAVKQAEEGVADYDVNTMASRQEMRTFVCAQCHVEYFFDGAAKTLTFPWSQGLTVEDALAQYDAAGFKDWTHAETGAPMLKAQHPEFELWSQSIHAQAGVSCADCHMPYKRVGASKISDHHVRSPLLNLNGACGSCHRRGEAELRERVSAIQVRHHRLVQSALDALVELIDAIKAADASGEVAAERLEAARVFQRRASFYVDYVEAENSAGFHAPQEAARILAESINFCRKGQRALVGLKTAAATH